MTSALTTTDILTIAQSTLERLPADEANAAYAWLLEHVIGATDLETQETMYASWLSVYNRFAYEMTLNNAGGN